MPRRRILLIEDDFTIRGVLAQILMDEGYEVVCAADGSEGFATLQSERAKPDAIILDVWMPHMDGLEFRALQTRFAETRGVPVVVITASRITDQQLRAVGLNHVLRKPIALAALLETLESVFKSRDGDRERAAAVRPPLRPA